MKYEIENIDNIEIFNLIEPVTEDDFPVEYIIEQERVLKKGKSSYHPVAEFRLKLVIPFDFTIPDEILQFIEIPVDFLRKPISCRAIFHNNYLELKAMNTTPTRMFDIKMNGVKTIDDRINRMNKVVDNFVNDIYLAREEHYKEIAKVIHEVFVKYNRHVMYEYLRNKYLNYYNYPASEVKNESNIINQQVNPLVKEKNALINKRNELLMQLNKVEVEIKFKELDMLDQALKHTTPDFSVKKELESKLEDIIFADSLPDIDQAIKEIVEEIYPKNIK